MARDTIAAAKTELFALLAPGGAPAVAGITVAYPFEPGRGQMQKPVALTVSTAGLTATDYIFAVRLYVAADVDAQAAQDTLDSIIQAVDVLLELHWGPGDWANTTGGDSDAVIAECRVVVGREDGHLRFSPRGEDTFS